MLLGDAWFVEHFRKTRKRGNTIAGRQWTLRVKQEKPVLTKICDRCGHKEITLSSPLSRVRHVVKQAVEQEQKWGLHLCPKCARKEARKKAAITRATPGWSENFGLQVALGLALIPSDKNAERYERARQTRIATYSRMTPKERRRGVVKQWQTMTEEAKQRRAKKIGEGAKKVWASLTPEQRNQRVARMIKGLPRSKISDDFRQHLIDARLYAGFVSEQVISGFTVDEANETLKVILEFFGDYYHCNPSNPKFSDPEFYNTTIRMTSAQKWQYDRRRLAGLRKVGYRILVVWESDWRKNPEDVLSRVRTFLNQFKTGSSADPTE